MSAFCALPGCAACESIRATDIRIFAVRDTSIWRCMAIAASSLSRQGTPAMSHLLGQSNAASQVTLPTYEQSSGSRLAEGGNSSHGCSSPPVIVGPTMNHTKVLHRKHRRSNTAVAPSVPSIAHGVQLRYTTSINRPRHSEDSTYFGVSGAITIYIYVVPRIS